MQILPLFWHGESQGPGSSYFVPEVYLSDLWKMIQAKFDALGHLPDLPGTPKLVQRRDNPDAFDLCFDAHRGGEHYQGERRYSLPGVGSFSKEQFEQFPQDAAACERRVDEFIRALQAGTLL